MVLTRKDLAKRWNVSLRTIDRWIRLKNIPHTVSMTGYYKFDEEEIKKWEKQMGLTGKKD